MRPLRFVCGGNTVSINYVEEFRNEEIVLRELQQLRDTMLGNIESISEGDQPNVFSADLNEDLEQLISLVSALNVVIPMYEVNREA